MKRKYDYKYTLGDTVLVKGEVSFPYNKYNKEKIRDETPDRIGKIVGCTFRYTGRYIPGCNASYPDWDNAESPEFRRTGTHFIWQVKSSLRGKITLHEDDQVQKYDGEFKLPIASYTKWEDVIKQQENLDIVES